MALRVPTALTKFVTISASGAVLDVSSSNTKFVIDTGSAATLKVSMAVMKFAVRTFPRHVIAQIVPATKTSQARKPYIKTTVS